MTDTTLAPVAEGQTRRDFYPNAPSGSGHPGSSPGGGTISLADLRIRRDRVGRELHDARLAVARHKKKVGEEAHWQERAGAARNMTGHDGVRVRESISRSLHGVEIAKRILPGAIVLRDDLERQFAEIVKAIDAAEAKARAEIAAPARTVPAFDSSDPRFAIPDDGSIPAFLRRPA